MKYELKRISVWSVIKITFVLNLFLGFLFGLFYAFIVLLITALPMSMMGEDSAGIFPALAGVAAFVLPFLFAFFFAVVYTIVAAIMTFAYNLVAKLTGGVEWELKEVPEIVKVSSAVTYPQPPTAGEQPTTA